MKHSIKNTTERANKILGQLAAEKKKAVLALSLVCVMAFMWIRVLTKKGPGTAKARSMPKMVVNGNDSDSNLQISYIELPNVPGRNNVVRRDYFASNGWKNFIEAKERNNSVGVEEVSVISTGGDEEVIALVAQKLELEAIVMGTSPKGWTGSNPSSGGRAFINDKLLGVGDKLLIRDKDNSYECEVMAISENTVLIRYGQAQIKLKLIRSIEVTD